MLVLLLEAEVDPDGCQIALLKGVVGEPPEQGRLADGAVADHDDLEQVVVLANHAN